MPENIATLRHAGLTEGEARIYLTSLELGPSPIQEIAKQAKFSRPATYAAVESLLEKGLLSSHQRGKRNFYAAETPERLLPLAELQVQNAQAKHKELTDVLANLLLLQRGDRPTVKMFEGNEALKVILEDMVRTRPAEIVDIANIDAAREEFTAQDLRRHHEALVALKVPCRVLLLGQSHYMRPGAEARVLPAGLFNFDGELFAYGNKIAMLTFHGRKIGVIVENAELAETFRVLFQLAWLGASQYPHLSGGTSWQNNKSSLK